MSNDLPGKGVFGWLGRQIGYLTRAAKKDVGGAKTIYRQSKVEERPMPENPSVTLRRTTIDEAIAEGKTQPPRKEI